MTILYAESMDGYANTAGAVAALQAVSNDIDYLTTGGRWGGGCLNGPSLDQGMLCNMIAAPATNLLRFAFHYKDRRDGQHSGSAVRCQIKFQNTAADRHLNLFITSQLQIANGISGNRYQTNLFLGRFDDFNGFGFGSVAISTVPIVDGNWHHIEVEYVAHATTGSVKVWIDGILDINLTNVNTNAAASGDVTALNRVFMAGSTQNSNPGDTDVRIDDVLVWDDSGSDFTGHLSSPHRLRNVLVNAAGDSAQFTPNTGLNHNAVDEATFDDDTTYVESNTAGHIDLYNIGTVGATLQTIRGVIVETIAKDTGATKTHRELLKSNGTVANGTTHAVLANAYRKYQSFYWTDPDGNIPWTQTSIEASQIGQEAVT